MLAADNCVLGKVLPCGSNIEAWMYLSPASRVTFSLRVGNDVSVSLLSRYGCGSRVLMRPTSSSCPLARQLHHRSSAVCRETLNGPIWEGLQVPWVWGVCMYCSGLPCMLESESWLSLWGQCQWMGQDISQVLAGLQGMRSWSTGT